MSVRRPQRRLVPEGSNLMHGPVAGRIHNMVAIRKRRRGVYEGDLSCLLPCCFPLITRPHSYTIYSRVWGSNSETKITPPLSHSVRQLLARMRRVTSDWLNSKLAALHANFLFLLLLICVFYHDDLSFCIKKRNEGQDLLLLGRMKVESISQHPCQKTHSLTSNTPCGLHSHCIRVVHNQTGRRAYTYIR